MNKLKNKLTKYLESSLMGNVIFPIILIIVGFCQCGRGIELADTAYNYGNFVNLPGLDNMWYCSTYLSCVFGRFFSFLPLGHTLLGLNIYTSVFKVILAIIAYFFFKNILKFSGSLSFFSELIALGLCWCPTALVYNYLTYLLMFLGAMFLYRGLTENNDKLLIVAGICLGTNVFVRFPNLCEMAIVFGLWFWCFVRKEKISYLLKKTGLCVAGYVGALVFWLIIISITRGFYNYVLAIQELFAMTDEAADYSSSGMLYGIYCAFRNSLYYQKFIVAFLVAAFIIWQIMNTLCVKRFSSNEAIAELLRTISSGIIVVMFAGLMLLLYKKKHFTLDYHEYSSFYWPGACIIGLAIVIFLVVIGAKRLPENLKLLSVLSLLVLFITPLGTNNELYASCNNLFFVLPVLVYIICNIPEWKGLIGVKLALSLYICFFAYQAVNFGLIYTFHDGEDMNQSYYTANKITAGVATQQDKAKAIDSFEEIFSDKSREVLIYGDVPGASFYFGLKPAISTTWPNLHSFSSAKFERDMELLEQKIKGGSEFPYLVLDENTASQLSEKSVSTSKKERILMDFIEKYGYKQINTDDTTRFMIIYDVD